VVAGVCLLGGLAGCGKSTASSKASAPPAKLVTPTQAPNKPAKEEPKFAFERPKFVRGIYVTAWSAGGKTQRQRLLSLLDKTELNTMVIDVRDDGDMYWKNDIPLAVECKANLNAITRPDIVFQDLIKHKVWPIARIACFRDHYVPKKHPEMAVQVASGKVWADRSGHTWLDPYNKKNWQYVADTVKYALDQGFKAIQLDYVRFPSEGKSTTQVFPAQKSWHDPKALHEDVIAEFCHYIRDIVKARGAEFSADNFGIISSSKSDQGIGQELEKISEPFDVMCPMVYPNHFAKGEYGIPDPNAAPYLILKKSLGDYKKRLPDKAIRPWLQDFGGYGVKQIQAQIKAAYEYGYYEYMMWNAANRFTAAAYKDTSGLHPKKGAVATSPASPSPSASPAASPSPSATPNAEPGAPKSAGH